MVGDRQAANAGVMYNTALLNGVGLAKRRFLAREQDAAVLALQRRLKAAFDPDDLLNPGKILPDP